MKIGDLKDIAYSSHGDIQMAVVYDYNKQKDIALGSVEYVMKEFGDLNLTRLQAYEHRLVFEVRL